MNTPPAADPARPATAAPKDVLRPDEDGFDEARRIWNGRFDERPAVIVRCHDADDVRGAVQLARASSTPISVRSGGHDYAGNSAREGSVLIDLSGMNRLHIDAERRVATAQPGVRWAGLDGAAQAFGLATPGGTVSSVGVPGFTLGGGSGYLSRKFGMGVDNLLAAEVVTADGRIVRASEENDSDLLWGLRGGGGNFGVVTSLELRLHQVGPEVLAGQIVYPYETAPEVLRRYRDFMMQAPDELQCYAFIVRVPPIEAFPARSHGRPAVFLVLCYAGTPARGREVVQPLAELGGEPLLVAVEPRPYTVAQQAFDVAMGYGNRWYSKAHYFRSLPDAAIDAVVTHAERLPGEFTVAYLGREGGAIGRVDPAATAFPHRDAAFSLHVFPGWTAPADDDEIIAWARAFHEATAPFATGGVYANLLDRDDRDAAQKAYGANLDRLSRLKAKWDPKNLFHMNHNVVPKR